MRTFDPQQPVESFKALVLDLVKDYRFNVEGLYLADGSIRPLPSEAAVVGKVLEVSIHEYLTRKLLQAKQLKAIPAQSDRVYPDVSFNGPLIFPHKFALDVKCARKTANGERTVSAITIATFDAEYFHYPDEKVGNIMMPYGSYTAHLALVALYAYEKATARNIELLVVEKWRVATRRRSSGTRCYVGASQVVADLRAEKGEFASEEDFNAFWRSQPISRSKSDRWRSKRAAASAP